MSSPQTNVVRIATCDELDGWFADHHGPVRIVGSGSRRGQRSAPPANATALDLSSLNAITRLDPGDQTCTVETGVRFEDLDQALAEHELALPCLGNGTIGGLFAADPFGPAAVPAQSPRSLLLGIDGVLASGQPFRSGARVVKSVAGFDVHKLFVGSRGSLFAVKRFHLRLKPRPRCERWFANQDLEQTEALTLLDTLRHQQVPPDVLVLQRSGTGSYAVRGRLAGRERQVDAMQKQHRLEASAAMTGDALGAFPMGNSGGSTAGHSAGCERLHGMAPPSQLAAVCDRAGDGSTLTWLGGGRFFVDTPSPAASDRALSQLDAQAGVAVTVCIGEPHRIGRGTPLDPGEQQLAASLKQALDPHGILV